ncbi:hypothetical protein ACQPYA_06625 [Micromonospora sp. CA-263727]|uniref:hypothetical protein n=1 Tax=Micromonospora sp. CA-263727 TaxID=3239967 RepID=UPI003D8C4C35
MLLTVGRVLDAGAEGVGGVLAGLLTGPLWGLLAGLAAVAAGGWALTRRAGVDFGVALAGACLALFAGVTNVAAFTRAVPPVPGPPTVARVLVALVVVAGAGALAAAVLRLHATGRAPAPGTRSTPAPASLTG